jgi:hypothetical protein
MITNHAVAAASCAGTWQQRWNCGWKQPTSSALPQAGYDFGHSLLPALIVLAVVVLLVRAAKRRGKSRSSASAGAGR